MATVNKYGFDCNGSTTINGYTNPTLNYQNTELSFKIIQKTLSTLSIFSGQESNNEPRIFIYTSGNNVTISLKGSGGIEIIVSAPITLNELTSVKCVFSENNTISIKLELYINDVLVDTNSSIQAIGYSTLYNNNIPFFNLAGNQVFDGIIADFIVKTNGVEVFNEPFNQTTKGTITGTEQYTIIGTEEVSTGSKLNLYVEPFNYNTDFVYKNKVATGNNSIPTWEFGSEYNDRLSDEYVQVLSNDFFVISNIKSLSYGASPNKNLYTMHITSLVSGSVDLYGRFFNGDNEVIETFNISVGDNYISLNLSDHNNLEKIFFLSPGIDFKLYLDTDIDIECWDTGVDVNVEGINVSVDTSLRSYKTLANTIYTTKLRNTQFAYTSELIITHEEFEQLNSFLDISRFYERNIIIDIVVDELVGDRIAGIPDIKTNKFILAELSITEKTGLYKYVTITYFNSKENKVR